MAKEGPKRFEMTRDELQEFFDRLERDELTDQDRSQIREVMTAVIWMAQKLEDKDLSIKRLQRLFGIKTEKAENLFKKDKATENGNDDDRDPPHQKPSERNRSEESKPAGKNGRDDYPLAQCVFHPHETLKTGDTCPSCLRGTLYSYGVGSIVRLTGQAPIVATIHEPEQLRCSACLELFTARLPDNVGEKKADATAKALVTIFRYGSGIPFFRNEKLQDFFQTPLPDSTQWDMSEEVLNDVYPIYQELHHQAAQGELFHSDDTGMRIVQLKKILELQKSERTGIQTTGILSKTEEHEIALFFTANRHAGENMQKILKMRDRATIPKLMCDAASKNKPKETNCEMANCLDHARRQFVDIIPKYTDQAQYFIEALRDVYHHDKKTKLLKLTPKKRLKYHREKSLPIMENLKAWCIANLNAQVAEPNSPLGTAMKYFLNHYEKLTKFTEIEGMPLSNSPVERLLKTVVLHRKNSLFYQTEMGALVGDVLMSIIQTAKRAKINVLHYLTQLQHFAKDVKNNPSLWLPWNYCDRISILQSSS